MTRKITDGVAKIKLGKLDCLQLGNLDAKRDWGYAKEYVEGMHLMLKAPEPETFVLATGRTETVKNFVAMAFEAVGTRIEWRGNGVEETGVISGTDKIVVRIDPRFYRLAEVDLLIGDSSKAQSALGWAPKTSLESLCGMMVEADLRRNKSGFSF